MTSVTAHICAKCGHAESRPLDVSWTYCARGCYGSIMRPVEVRLPAETTGLLSPWSNPSIPPYQGLATPGVLIATGIGTPEAPASKEGQQP